MSRGHRFADVVDGYPVGLVINLHRAGRENRRHEALELAVGVSLGIRDALSKDGKLLQAWLGAEKQTAPRPPGKTDLERFMKKLPVVRQKRRGKD